MMPRSETDFQFYIATFVASAWGKTYPYCMISYKQLKLNQTLLQFPRVKSVKIRVQI